MLRKNVAGQRVNAQMVTASDGSAFTGTVTCYVVGGGSGAVLGSVSSGVCVSKSNGLFSYSPSQAETNHDVVSYTFIGTGAIPVTRHFYPDTYANIADAVYDEEKGGHVTADTFGEWFSSNETRIVDIFADTEELQTLLTSGGALDLLINAIKDRTDYLPEAEVGTTEGIAGHATLELVAEYVAELEDAILTSGVVLSAAMMNKIADHVRRRTQANVAASSDGDALSLGSEYGAIQQGQYSDTTTHTGKLTTFNPDGSELGQSDVSVNAGADPMVGINP